MRRDLSAGVGTLLLCLAWCWLGVILGTTSGCAAPAPVVIDPPAPVVDPPPIPVPPRPDPVMPTPEPTPKAETAPWAKVQQVVAGMTLDALRALLGPEEDKPRDQGDGSAIHRWPAVNEAGAPRWLDVQVEGGVVLGRALWKR